jgi:MOSC domain-containing protein YiiM
MWEGTIAGIFITPEKSTPVRSVEEVEAVEGKGLVGDRYFVGAGTWSDHPGAGREVTLIEREAIEALAGESGISIEPGQARRNLVTSGVPLNHLVGQDFRVGEVVLRGMRLCEPCQHMESLTKPGVRKGLIHRGGLRADIVSGGVIRTGDRVGPLE